MKPLPAIPISDLTFWNWVARHLANFEVVSAIPTVDKLKNGDAIIYESGTARRLYVNINGTIRFLGINNGNKIVDLDGDTWVEVERTADGDRVWIRTGGTDRIKIDENGITYIGDAGTANYLKIEADGTLEFNGNATVFDDLQVPISTIRLGGASPADEVAYKDGIVLSFDNAVDEFIYFTAQLPHSYKEGSNLVPHIHWTPKVNGSGGGAENVKWDLTYSWSNKNGTIPASSSATITIDVQNDSVDDHLKDNIATLSGSGKEISSLLICSLKRDTAVANNYADEAYLIGLDFHFEKDTVGSRQILTK